MLVNKDKASIGLQCEISSTDDTHPYETTWKHVEKTYIRENGASCHKGKLTTTIQKDFFIQQECIRLIKSDSRDIYNGNKKIYCKSILMFFIQES